MRETIQWYIENRKWWQTIQQKMDAEAVQEDKWETFSER